MVLVIIWAYTLPTGSKYPNIEVFGPMYYTRNSLWDLIPCHLVTWTLGLSFLGPEPVKCTFGSKKWVHATSKASS